MSSDECPWNGDSSGLCQRKRSDSSVVLLTVIEKMLISNVPLAIFMYSLVANVPSSISLGQVVYSTHSVGPCVVALNTK